MVSKIHFFSHFFVISASPPAIESHEPLLSDRENPVEPIPIQSQPPLISYPIPITTSSEIPTHSGIVTEVKQTLSNRFATSTQSSSYRYSPVYKNPENHIEELNFRLNSINDRVYSNYSDDGAVGIDTVVPDINPSVGSDNDKESELNIRQLESSVSSLSGLPSGSSTVHSPEAVHKRQQIATNWHIERYETDF